MMERRRCEKRRCTQLRGAGEPTPTPSPSSRTAHATTRLLVSFAGRRCEERRGAGEPTRGHTLPSSRTAPATTRLRTFAGRWCTSGAGLANRPRHPLLPQGPRPQRPAWVVRQAAVEELARAGEPTPTPSPSSRTLPATTSMGSFARRRWRRRAARGWRTDAEHPPLPQGPRPQRPELARSPGGGAGAGGSLRGAGEATPPPSPSSRTAPATTSMGRFARRRCGSWRGAGEPTPTPSPSSRGGGYRAGNDQHEDVRRAAVQELSRGWRNRRRHPRLPQGPRPAKMNKTFAQSAVQ